MLDKVHVEVAKPDDVLTGGQKPVGHLDLPDLEYREKHSIGLRLCLLTPAKRREILEASKLRISGKTEVDVFTLDDGRSSLSPTRSCHRFPAGSMDC